MVIDCEKLRFMLNSMRYDIEILIENVLQDSEDDPHYSAVTANSLVKCYIEIMEQLGDELPFSNVEEFIRNLGYSEDEYLIFEKKRMKEAVYYRGVQY